MAFRALDTTQNTSPLIPCLTQSGITAVGRYYTRKRNSWKIVKLPEVQALSAAGIQLWPVYQITHRDPSHFSSTLGRSEANDALDYAMNVIGQPRGSAIYFAADYDASQSHLNNAIIPHFEAVGAAFAAVSSPYRIGVYGSGLTCKTLLDRGLVQLTWLSQSGGFRGTPDFKASRRWNLLQLLPVRNFCNFEDEIDPDITNDDIGDIGAFMLQAPQPQFVHSSAPMPSSSSAPAPSGSGSTAAPTSGGTVTTLPAAAPMFHVPLSRGMVGSPDVKALQIRLNELKFGPLVADGDFGERTSDAVLHFQARNSSADGRPLAIDGEVGPTTWAALFGPGAVPSTQPLDVNAPLRQLVIDIAASQIGVVEQPIGSNRGPEVDAYIRATGLDPTADSFPWCVCFLYWTFGQAAQVKGMANPLPKTAGVISLWNLGRNSAGHVVRASEANAKTVKPGMIFHLDTGGGKGHAGLVVEVSGDRIVTIEGNTNQGGSREGFGVFRRSSRPIKPSVLLGYLDFCE